MIRQVLLSSSVIESQLVIVSLISSYNSMFAGTLLSYKQESIDTFCFHFYRILNYRILGSTYGPFAGNL